MNALIQALKRLNYRTLIVLALIGLIVVPTLVVAMTLDLMAPGGEAADIIADGPKEKPTPTPPPPVYEDFAWGG